MSGNLKHSALNSGDRSLLLRLVALLLIGVYGYGMTVTSTHEAVEHHFHADSQETCSPADHVDACHQMIYHGEQDGCKHDAHLYASIHNCSFCDILMTKNQVNDLGAITIKDYTDIAFFSGALLSIHYQAYFGYNPLRGPPAV